MLKMKINTIITLEIIILLVLLVFVFKPVKPYEYLHSGDEPQSLGQVRAVLYPDFILKEN